MGQPGEVLRFEPERALEWEWGGERFRFELSPDGRQAIAEQFGTS